MVALSRYPIPLALTLQPLKVATPALTVDVQPESDPDAPDGTRSAKVEVLSVVMVLPNASWMATFGCVRNGVAAGDVLGC
jgi:hypothetical protein